MIKGPYDWVRGYSGVNSSLSVIWVIASGKLWVTLNLCICRVVG